MDRSGTGRDAEARGLDPGRTAGGDGPGGRGEATRRLAPRGGRAVGPAPEGLLRPGIRVHAGHPPRSARLWAMARGIGPATGPEGVGLAVAGGRRAGVAAAMIGWTLAHAGQDPTVLLDTFAPQLGGWGRPGGGPLVVAEVGDEPIAAEVLVLLDDAGCPEARSRSLGRRVEAASAGDYLLGYAAGGDPPGCGGGASPGVEVERFSLIEGREWWGADVREDRGGSRFRAFHRGRFVAEVRLRVHGTSSVVAALAAVAACARADLPARAIKEGLEEFAGVSRGFESRGSYRGVTLVDDEARGPAAAGEALDAARRVFGRRRLCVAYRHGAGGGDGWWPAAGEFAAADRVWIIDEEGAPGGPAAGSLAEALIEAGARVARVDGLDGAIRELDRHLEPGDVLVTLGPGDVGTIADAFLRRLPRDRHG